MKYISDQHDTVKIEIRKNAANAGAISARRYTVYCTARLYSGRAGGTADVAYGFFMFTPRRAEVWGAPAGAQATARA